MIRGITVAFMVANILISIFIILINEELWIKILPLPWLFPSSYFSGSSHVPLEFPAFLSLLGFSDTRNLLASTHNWGWSSPAKVLKCAVSTTNAWFEWDGVACPHTLILYSVQANITYEWKQSGLNCKLILNPWSTKIPKLCVQFLSFSIRGWHLFNQLDTVHSYSCLVHFIPRSCQTNQILLKYIIILIFYL